MIRETPLVFDCQGYPLVGVMSHADRPSPVGVLILIGGDQYRAGSHRQFVLLARALAARGYPSLRFDYRGMGDSTGDAVDFEDVGPDISAARDQLFLQCPDISRVVVVGLCDAASATLMFSDLFDGKLAGVCLLNPWMRSEHSFAKAQIKHYYLQRLVSRAFWVKLVSGRVKVRQALSHLLTQGSRWVDGRTHPERRMAAKQTFRDRMLRGIQSFSGEVLLILSGNDLTAREFEEFTNSSAAWQAQLRDARVRKVVLPEADHTFSSGPWRREVEVQMVRWLDGISKTR